MILSSELSSCWQAWSYFKNFEWDPNPKCMVVLERGITALADTLCLAQNGSFVDPSWNSSKS